MTQPVTWTQSMVRDWQRRTPDNESLHYGTHLAIGGLQRYWSPAATTISLPNPLVIRVAGLCFTPASLLSTHLYPLQLSILLYHCHLYPNPGENGLCLGRLNNARLLDWGLSEALAASALQSSFSWRKHRSHCCSSPGAAPPKTHLCKARALYFFNSLRKTGTTLGFFWEF